MKWEIRPGSLDLRSRGWGWWKYRIMVDSFMAGVIVGFWLALLLVWIEYGVDLL